MHRMEQDPCQLHSQQPRDAQNPLEPNEWNFTRQNHFPAEQKRQYCRIGVLLAQLRLFLEILPGSGGFRNPRKHAPNRRNVSHCSGLGVLGAFDFSGGRAVARP